MREAVGAVLDLRAPRPAGLPKLVSWSFTIHLLAAAGILAWQAWLSSRVEDDKIMMISLAGSPGPITGGATPIGGKQVDQVAPEPKRPEPVPVTEPPKSEIALPAKPKETKPLPPRDAGPQRSSVVRPAPASQVQTGSSVIDTGARGEGAGLATGGGGQNAAIVDPEFLFCCPAYLAAMDDAIRRNVTWSIGSGTTVVKFVVGSDGKLDLANIKTYKSSGVSTVDNDAIFAVRKAILPPLPKEYSKPSLTVELTIKYP